MSFVSQIGADIRQAGSASIFDPRREGQTSGTNDRTRTLLRQPLFFRVTTLPISRIW
jgi:hypothetical protein